jgi:hypothetical protein
MYMICRHIETNGIRCQSPALASPKSQREKELNRENSDFRL